MATFIYKCTDCDKEQEVHHPMKDEPILDCIYCHKFTLKKVFTPVGIVFKGNGWAGKS